MSNPSHGSNQKPRFTDLSAEGAGVLKILHISDLHVPEISDQVEQGLSAHAESVKPHIIAVTGDIVDFPWQSSFNSAKRFIDALKVHCKRCFVVPGNHDALFWRGRSFRKAFGSYVLGSEFIKAAEQEHVTFFGFDSTLVTERPDSWHFRPLHTRGFVRPSVLREFYSSVEQLKKEYGTAYLRSFKVALLHHHPLPARGSDWEQTLYLKNAGEFLDAMRKNQIDLILHGHRHESLDYSFLMDKAHSEKGRYSEAGRLLVLSAGALKHSTDPQARAPASYVIYVSANELYIRQFQFNSKSNRFEVIKAFNVDRWRPEFFKKEVEHSWKIFPNGDNERSTKLVLRGWAGESTRASIDEVMVSTVEPITHVVVNEARRTNGQVNVALGPLETSDDVGGRVFLKRVKYVLAPSLHVTIDDEIEYSYVWPGDFAPTLIKNGYTCWPYLAESADRLRLVIHDHELKLHECRIWCPKLNTTGKQIAPNTYEWLGEAVSSGTVIWFHLSLA